MSDTEALVAFDKARLNEDEAAARESYYEGQHWLTEEEGVYRWPDDELVHMADRKADARHIARHGPGRVLREVEAKRGRLALMIEAQAEMDAALSDKHAGDVDRAMKIGRARGATVAVKWDATVHGDHPDYRPEWKP